MDTRERAILRELAKQYLEIASKDSNQKKIESWKALNTLKPQRPLVMIDQLPWHELNINEELSLRCKTPFLRHLEQNLRMLLFRYNHFPVDFVFRPFLELPKSVSGNTLGPVIHQDVLATDSANSVVSHRFHDILKTPEDLDAIPYPAVKGDPEGDKLRLRLANELIGDVLPVRLTGHTVHCGVWDFITQLRGVSEMMMDFVDRPEFMLQIVHKFVDMAMSLVDQYEQLGLLEYDQALIHCTGAFNDELPKSPKISEKQQSGDVWAFGLAQALGPVSPEMYNEFEIQPLKPLLERFGLIYYGCCDPIDKKIGYLRSIRNVRKISVSPWADKNLCAELIHGDYVFSAKPNPAYLAFDSFDEHAVRAELAEITSICRKNNTRCEFILKDVSTVCHKPANLFSWAKIAMEVAQS
jgi:hypothetical protein